VTCRTRRAVTDAEAEVRYDPAAKPGVSNLIEILGARAGEKAADLAGKYDSYGALKNDCAKANAGLFAP
jgi:tryptophanyl-tRNA synthetase